MKFNLVLKNSFFYTLASGLQGMISFFLLPIYTRYLSPADYAVLALVTSFIGIVSSVITFQVHAGIPRFVIKFLKDENRAKTYYSSIFFLLLGILLFSCFLINLFGDRIIKVIFSDKNNLTYSPFFQIATWTLLPTLLVSAGLLLLQTQEKGQRFFSIILIQVMVNVSFGILFVVFLRTGIVGILWAQLISAVCGLGFIIWSTRDWFRWVISKFALEDIKNSLRYSLPIVPHMLSIYIYMYSDRLILQRFVPLDDIGIYSIADTFALVLLTIVNATTTAYSPRFLKIAEDSRAKAQEETKRFIGLWWVGIMVIFMGYLILSNHAVRLMTRPSFYPCIPLIPVLASAYIFRGLYCFSMNSIFFVEKTKFAPMVTISAALVNVILNLIFIPRFGIFAAAWTTVVSYMVTFILAYYFSARHFLIIYPWRKMINIVMLLFLFYISVKFFSRILPEVFWLGFIFNLIAVVLFGITAVMATYRIKDIKALALKTFSAGWHLRT